MVKPDDTLCTYCGMTCAQGEYHPYGVCLMVKACRNTETVRANLAAMREHFQAEVSKDYDALIRQLADALDECAEDSATVVNDYVQAYGENHRPLRLKAMRETVTKAKDALAAARARLEKAP